MSRDMKRRVSTVMLIAKTAFHWGFIPTVLYLGSPITTEMRTTEMHVLTQIV